MKAEDVKDVAETIEKGAAATEAIAGVVPGGAPVAIAAGVIEQGAAFVADNADAIVDGVGTVLGAIEHLAEDVSGNDLDGDGTVGA